MGVKTDAQSEGFEPHELHIEPQGTAEDWVRPLPARRRGRPPKMSPQELLDRIRRLAVGRGGLFRLHRRNSSLYARARRLFGSWSKAVQAAGLDYGQALSGARQRSVRTRKLRSRRSPATP